MADPREDDRLFDPGMPEALRNGLDQLDNAESLAETIKDVQGEIDRGLARMTEMRELLLPEYHSTFNVLVERGYMPVVESQRTTIRACEKAIEGLRSNARSAAEGGGDA
jgi:hypothetical protein